VAERRHVLVLGATSLIGRRLMREAWPEGVTLTALSRAPPVDADGRATWLTGDLEERSGRGNWADQERSSLKLPLADAILSLSPIWLLPAALPALLATGVRRIVAVSSTSRLTKLDSPVATEREVARRLASGEDALVAACEAAGVAWTILRPTMIYAEGEDANVTRLARLIARFGVLPLAGRGGGLRQPVHAADLAAAVWQALDGPGAAGRAYALPGGETLSYRAMAVRIFEALGRPVRIVPVPPSAMGDRMARDLAFDAGPAAHDFGYAPRPFRPDFSGVMKISRA
jgi:nucleoside-diphosphate-sugar epimerase